jgi:hypothetical protein
MTDAPSKFDPRSGKPYKTLAQILSRYTVSPTGCWEWTGTQNGHGYGLVCVMIENRRMGISPHRLQWMHHYGPIPDGLVVMHTCDTGLCINPAHLAVGSQAANLADMRAKGRADTSGLLNQGGK